MRQTSDGELFRESEAHRSGHQLLIRHFHQLVKQGENAFGRARHDFTFMGQLYASRMPVEEPRAHDPLELLDLDADR